MSRAFVALSWELLTRKWWLMAATLGYFTLLCLTIPLLPESAHPEQVGPALAVPLFVALPFVLGVLANGLDVRLDQPTSGFPPRLFLLPVSTLLLVAPSLLLCAGVLIGGWVLLAALVFSRAGADVPLVWPGLLAAACFAWVQALAWSPFPHGLLRWLRIILIALLFPAVSIGGNVLHQPGTEPWLRAGLLLAILAAAWVAAHRGVALGRRGVGLWAPAWAAPEASRMQGTFPVALASPLRAQLWLEFRLRRVGFVWIAGLSTVLILTAVRLTEKLLREQPYLVAEIGLTAVLETWGPGWLSLVWLFLIPFSCALFGGPDFARFTYQHGQRGFPAFVATLPLSDARIVRAKVFATGLWVLALWLWVALLAGGWAAAAGHVGDMGNRLLCQAGSWPAATGLAAGGMLLAVAVSWLLAAAGLWVGFLRHPWLVVILWGGVSVVPGLMIKFWGPGMRAALAGAILVLLAGKAAGAVALVPRLLRENLASAGTLAWLLVGWAALAAAAASLAGLALPGEWMAPAGAVALTPLTQCLLAPLALSWDRHRR